MNTDNNSREGLEYAVPAEFQFLEQLIYYRLGYSGRPVHTQIEEWSFYLKQFIIQAQLKEEDEIILLLIALAPHAVPDLFDRAIQEKIKASGDFPEIGGVRGKNFRGFIPTGQTAVFLLAGDDRNKQMEIEQLFWSDRTFARRKILWLEDLPQGEPFLSGRIIMAPDYIGQILFGNAAPPHFSSSFPARHIKTILRSKDIMMNEEIRRHYRSLKDWIEFNPGLMEDWNMKKRLKKGYRVLFYGPPGTGKTLTATVLGNETGKMVYKIDLSMIVSKYIGETEKNLELLFARAEDKDWILLFDEADAIFGKRTNVKDSHDKYANQEVSYLLQRIEEFDGLVILTTNMKNNIDDAFIRRFDDIVRFSVPVENERLEIWEKSFPKNAQYNDIPQRVKKHDISGGNIINAIHFAGIQAIKKRKEQRQPAAVHENGTTEEWMEQPEKLLFHLEDIVEGIRREMIKEGRPFA